MTPTAAITKKDARQFLAHARARASFIHVPTVQNATIVVHMATRIPPGGPAREGNLYISFKGVCTTTPTSCTKRIYGHGGLQ